MSLKTLWLKIKGDNKGLKSSLKQSESSINKFGKTVKRLGGMIAGAFAFREIIRFGKEVVGLASKAEGVKAAFAKLGDPKLLANLREATRGTVDDLTLMQKAVQAKNFKIPLDQLATYFKFATNRAIETGESVDYLVESIIAGIGRKSVLVMDNLGISAVELQEETKRLGDFGAAAGAIIAREVENAGEVADTTATKIASLTTKWQNFKTKVGEALIESGVVDQLIAAAEAIVKGGLGLISPKAALAMEETAKLQKELEESKKRQAESQEIVYEVEKDFANLGILQIKQRLELKNLGNDALKQVRKEREYQEQINEILKERSKIVPPGGGGKSSVSPRVSAPGTIGGAGGIDTGALGIDTSYLREMGYASGLEWTDAFSVAAKESFARWEALDTLKAGLQEAASMIVDSVEMIFESIGSGEFDKLGDDLLLRFADFLSQLGKLMIAYGTAMLMFSILSKSPDPVSAGLAIAAGLAAIAIAGLIRGAASGAADGLSGGGSYGSSYSGATSGGGMQPLSNSIEVQGVLKGSDIVISSRRYTNGRNSVT